MFLLVPRLPRKQRGLGGGGGGDLVAEAGESAEELVGELLFFLGGEVVGAEVVVMRVGRLEQMVGNPQDRMAHRDAGLFAAASASQVAIMRRQVVVLGVRARLRGFRERPPEPLISFPAFSAPLFARRFVLPRAHPGPRSQVPVVGKTAHVHADFTNQNLR